MRKYPLPSFATQIELPEGWDFVIENNLIYFYDSQTRTKTMDDPRERELPPDWEMKWDSKSQRPFFLNHQNKSSTWIDPRFKSQYPINCHLKVQSTEQQPNKQPQQPQQVKPQQHQQPQPQQPPQQNPQYQQPPQQYPQYQQPAMQNNQSTPSINIVINGKQLTEEEIKLLKNHGSPCLPGRYWYDPTSGGFGLEGGPCLSIFVPNLKVGGPLQPNASNGNTGVFINGRQLHTIDVMNWQNTIGPCLPGRYIVDAFGNCYFENGIFICNTYQVIASKNAANNQKKGFINDYFDAKFYLG